jgi:hypothetical protein
MSTTTVNYGTRTQFPQYTNLNSLANNAAKPLGKIDNSATGGGNKANNIWIDVDITLGASGVSTTGSIELYLLESKDDTTYTDGISPTGTSDIASSLKNATLFKVLAATANSQVIRWRQRLGDFLSDMPKYGSIVAYNKSGAALAASGNDAGYDPLKVDIA